jgi:hypothetical protein
VINRDRCLPYPNGTRPGGAAFLVVGAGVGRVRDEHVALGALRMNVTQTPDPSRSSAAAAPPPSIVGGRRPPCKRTFATLWRARTATLNRVPPREMLGPTTPSA